MDTPGDCEMQRIWCLEKKCAVEVILRWRKQRFGHYAEVVNCPVRRAGGTCCAQGSINRCRVRG